MKDTVVGCLPTVVSLTVSDPLKNKIKSLKKYCLGTTFIALTEELQGW